jgi:hypothetical protein
MIIIIDCDESDGAIIRDALHNYYHETKPLLSARAHANGRVCKNVADKIKAFFMSGSNQTFFDGRLRVTIKREYNEKPTTL